MLRRIKLLLTAQVLAIFVAALVLSGFGSCKITPAQAESQLTRVAKASRSMAQYTGEAITLVRTSYETGLLKVDIKDRVLTALRQFSIDGKSFNDLVVQLSKQYSSGTLPSDVWQLVVQNFDKLTKVFVDIVTSITGAAGIADSKPFKFIVAAVVTIAQVLLTVGALNGLELPSWADIERAVPNWREYTDLPSFKKEVLGELA